MRIRTLGAAAVMAAAVLVPALPADAAPAIQIVKVYYDSPGSDDRSNKSLNAEWVRIKNTSKKTRLLTGWTLRDKSGHVYLFGVVKIGAKKTLTIRTGKGLDTKATLYQQRGSYVWNNTGDTATLKNAVGKKIDSCTFPGTREWINC